MICKAADDTNVRLYECEEDKECVKFVEEQQLKTFSCGIINSNKDIKEEKKDTIFNAVKSELSEFQNYLGNNIKFETFKDVKCELKEEELDDHTNSEIQRIKKLEDVCVKIEHNEPLTPNNDHQCNSSSVIELVDEHKLVTVPFQKHAETVPKPFKRKRKNTNSVNPIIKVKHPQTLGIVEENKYNTSEDCRTKLLVAEQISSSNSLVEKVCRMFDYYFNSFFEQQLYNLIDLLKQLLKEISDNCERLSVFSSHRITIEDILLDHDSYRSVLQKYSKKFFKTFCSIVEIFQNFHKKEMIPIIYLVLLTETVTSVKLEDVRSIILKLLILENYNCEHDVIFSKTHIESQKMLIIYERWLEKYNTKHGTFFGRFNKINNGSDCILQNIECENTQPKCTIEDRSIKVTENSNAVSSVVSSVDVDHKKPTSNIDSLSLDVQGSLQQNKQTSSNFESKESKDLLQSCTNGMCVNKLTERCCFCLDCCSCPDFCQVEDDQMVADKYISCNEHKSFIAFWEEAHTTDWHRVVKDHEMPYDPVCWRSNCGKKALIICVCKTRAYCGFKCREEDWNESHHKTCSGSTDPSQFYSTSC
ncbi:uncharacterized protein LOC124360522 isoform X1 [Homalodisca vitripennis]|uniref:uncharacterized protein LOC124360522 isoform X1 n=1 Tax=Homalodisca vitripennis TaxID=197043 RepID=UPI001EEAD0FF|nr:uncharacterized protein LOC124360522 isoform X1 [Homalodisca vitripennis]XP_046670174.1 uncharacterized protein LOC124360522 isoform X1 [Homalodisca vitripennis]